MNKCNCKFHSSRPSRESLESYSYVRNEPKNKPEIKLTPVEENYRYGYTYATYKPAQHLSYEEEEKEDKVWPGVL